MSLTLQQTLDYNEVSHNSQAFIVFGCTWRSFRRSVGFDLFRLKKL